jgi:hypothetical protein
MVLRGASEAEVVEAIREGEPEAGKLNRLRAKRRFDFQGISPVNNKFYGYKTVESTFAEEPEEIVVVTVKVYYSNEGESS